MFARTESARHEMIAKRTRSILDNIQSMNGEITVRKAMPVYRTLAEKQLQLILRGMK